MYTQCELTVKKKIMHHTVPSVALKEISVFCLAIGPVVCDKWCNFVYLSSIQLMHSTLQYNTALETKCTLKGIVQ